MSSGRQSYHNAPEKLGSLEGRPCAKNMRNQVGFGKIRVQIFIKLKKLFWSEFTIEVRYQIYFGRKDFLS